MHTLIQLLMRTQAIALLSLLVTHMFASCPCSECHEFNLPFTGISNGHALVSVCKDEPILNVASVTTVATLSSQQWIFAPLPYYLSPNFTSITSIRACILPPYNGCWVGTIQFDVLTGVINIIMPYGISTGTWGWNSTNLTYARVTPPPTGSPTGSPTDAPTYPPTFSPTSNPTEPPIGVKVVMTIAIIFSFTLACAWVYDRYCEKLVLA